MAAVVDVEAVCYAELTAGKLTVAGNALAGASGTYAIRGELDNQGKLSVTDELCRIRAESDRQTMQFLCYQDNR